MNDIILILLHSVKQIFQAMANNRGTCCRLKQGQHYVFSSKVYNTLLTLIPLVRAWCAVAPTDAYNLFWPVSSLFGISSDMVFLIGSRLASTVAPIPWWCWTDGADRSLLNWAKMGFIMIGIDCMDCVCLTMFVDVASTGICVGCAVKKPSRCVTRSIFQILRNKLESDEITLAARLGHVCWVHSIKCAVPPHSTSSSDLSWIDVKPLVDFV